MIFIPLARVWSPVLAICLAAATYAQSSTGSIARQGFELPQRKSINRLGNLLLQRNLLVCAEAKGEVEAVLSDANNVRVQDLHGAWCVTQDTGSIRYFIRFASKEGVPTIARKHVRRPEDAMVSPGIMVDSCELRYDKDGKISNFVHSGGDEGIEFFANGMPKWFYVTCNSNNEKSKYYEAFWNEEGGIVRELFRTTEAPPPDGDKSVAGAPASVVEKKEEGSLADPEFALVMKRQMERTVGACAFAQSEVAGVLSGEKKVIQEADGTWRITSDAENSSLSVFLAGEAGPARKATKKYFAPSHNGGGAGAEAQNEDTAMVGYDIEYKDDGSAVVRFHRRPDGELIEFGGDGRARLFRVPVNDREDYVAEWDDAGKLFTEGLRPRIIPNAEQRTEDTDVIHVTRMADQPE